MNRRKKKRARKALGFTNRMAVYLMLLLGAGLLGGYKLAVMSIQAQYCGSLLCWTVVFTPMGYAISGVLGKIVDKNRDENTGGDNPGIIYSAAQASGFEDWNSPEI